MGEAVKRFVGQWGLSVETTIVLICQVIILGLWFPWMREVNKQLAEAREFMASTQSWMDQGPRFTQQHADNLRLTVLYEVSKSITVAAESSAAARSSLDMLSSRVTDLVGRITEFRDDLRRHLERDTP